MEALPDWVATLSPLGALVVILVFLLRAVANGSLVPRSTVDFMRAVLEEQVRAKTEEAATHALARATAQEVAAEQAEAIRELAEGQEAIVAMFKAIPQPPGEPK